MMARLSVAMAIVPLGARSLRVEVSIGRTSSVHAVANCSSASRPTHFVALRLGDSVLHKAVQSVQRKVVLVDGRLNRARYLRLRHTSQALCSPSMIHRFVEHVRLSPRAEHCRQAYLAWTYPE